MSLLDPPTLIAAAMLGALVFYALSAGADFGGGVWDLLAVGRHRAAQRALIERAIGPIWEANHVWLILVLVLLFAAFPPAFARIATVLHAPILLLLLFVVLRGVAFTFRLYDRKESSVQRRWGALFSTGSLAAPVLMGTIIGALTSGESARYRGATLLDATPLWLAAWPLSLGAFTLALFAYLAAVYLCVEAREDDAGSPALVTAFRRRALAGWLVSALLALALFFQARGAAPEVALGLTSHGWSLPILALTGLAALLALRALWSGSFRVARGAAALQVAAIVIGWGAAQHPWLLVGEHAIADSAAHPRVLRTLLVALVAGSLLLFPSLYYLLRAFKGRRPFSLLDRPQGPDA